MDNQQLKLAEYQQAVEMCKNHDSLIRTGITIFGAAQAAILTMLAQDSVRPEYEFSLNLIGLTLCVIVFFTTYRLARRYGAYMARAKKLEDDLDFQLLSSSQAEFDEGWLLKIMPGNKAWLAGFPAVMGGVYIFLLYAG
jgi:hypothetical protein